MAAGTTRWRTKCRGAVLFAILLQVVNGYEEIYTISQLSPKSESVDLPEDQVFHTTQSDNLAFKIEPSLARYDDLDDLEPENIVTDEETEKHVIVARSADPNDRESRSLNFDEIPSSNNEIDNEIELHNKRKYYDIHPTKTTGFSHENEVLMSSDGDRFEFNFPGEARRAPKARALPLGPRIRPSAVQPMYATINPNEGRQNTEIQNIITGIVKLLNGNVNVQANTQLLRPGRPMNSRINNRGPPRISDVPPMPDFDKPLTPPTHTFHPTKTPPPYPFDRPHHGVNLPEQIVPPLNPHRPGFHRPNIPPWQRPRPRPPNMPGRRPNPGLPIYKPPPMPVDIPNLDEEEEAENETNHDNHLVQDEKETVPLLDLPVSNTTEENEKEENKLTTAPETTSSTTTTTTTTTEKTTTSTTEKTTTETPKTTTEKAKTTTETVKTTTEKPKTTTERKPTTERPKTTTERKPTTEKAKTTTETKTTTEKAKVEKKPEKKKEPFIADKKDKYKIDEKPGNKTKIETIIDIIESSIDEYKSSSSAAAAATPTEGLMSHAPTVSVSESPHSVMKTSSINAQPLPSSQTPYRPYRRPGIVLDDPDFKPAGSRRPVPDAPVLTAPLPGYGEIFDVTVSAIQGPGEKGGASVHIENVNPISGHAEDDIIVSPSGEQGFVSIDGKRTYLNLFDTSSHHVEPTRVQSMQHSAPPTPVHHSSHPSHPPAVLGTGVAVPADPEPVPPRRPPAYRPRPRPQATVRIDTCIVGDDSTCDQAQNEKCRTEAGISSCQCRPGFARRAPRDPCRRVVALVLNLRVDRLYDKPLTWDNKLTDKDSELYQQLSYEAIRAIDSAFSMTPFSDEFVSGSINSVHRELGSGVYVNYTILMSESGEMLRPAVGAEMHKQVLGVLRRRSNNVGASALWVDHLAGAVAPLKDLDECATPEYNDCHQLAHCINTWGGFRCSCPDTTLDAQESGPLAGRDCRACASSHCNERGTCHYTNRRPTCSCSSGYYGSTCEVDGEVVGVAVGASLAAALVIAATLAALLSWSRKWSREQKAAGMGSPVFSYMQGVNTIKAPPVGGPPYQVTLEERMRWAQIAEAMAQSNHYATESQTMATRPSSAMFGGYPTLPPVPMPRLGLHHSGTLNTVASRANTAGSHHNLYGYTNHMATESSSSEASSHAQERADLLHAPRPKSRARSLHNQTGIYYDVEYENAEPIYGAKGIPLSTYTVSRGPPFYRA